MVNKKLSAKLYVEAMDLIVTSGLEGDQADQLLAAAWGGSDSPETILETLTYEQALNAVKFELQAISDATDENKHVPPAFLLDDRRRKSVMAAANNLAQAAGVIGSKAQSTWIHQRFGVESLNDLPSDMTEVEFFGKLKSSETQAAIDKFNGNTGAGNQIEVLEAEMNALLKKLFKSTGTIESRQRLMSEAWSSPEKDIDNIPDALTEYGHNIAWGKLVNTINAKAMEKTEATPKTEKQQPSSQSKAVATTNNSAALPDLYRMADSALQSRIAYAQILIDSGFLPAKITKPSQVIVLQEMARAINIPEITAYAKLSIIGGIPTIPPEIMIALAERTGQLEDLTIEDDDNTCIVVVKRRNRSAYTASFSMEDAERMGLSGKDNWRKQPKTMRKWRAISAALKVTFPDALAGISYTPEELDSDYEVIEESE